MLLLRCRFRASAFSSVLAQEPGLVELPLGPAVGDGRKYHDYHLSAQNIMIITSLFWDLL